MKPTKIVIILFVIALMGFLFVNNPQDYFTDEQANVISYELLQKLGIANYANEVHVSDNYTGKRIYNINEIKNITLYGSRIKQKVVLYEGINSIIVHVNCVDGMIDYFTMVPVNLVPQQVQDKARTADVSQQFLKYAQILQIPSNLQLEPIEKHKNTWTAKWSVINNDGTKSVVIEMIIAEDVLVEYKDERLPYDR